MDAGLPGIRHIGQWHLGIPPGGIPRGDGGIGFTATELAAGLSGAALSGAALSGAGLSGAGLSGAASRIGLHTAMAAELPRAGSVRVRVPGYRGKSLIPVLSWLVTYRLARPGAEVSWYLERQQGPRSFGALLAGLGWQDVERTRDGALARISARPPPLPEAALPEDALPQDALPQDALAEAELPEARQFSAVIGGHELTFLADYGVFSPDRIDDGSRLLAEVMLRRPPAGVIADIGVGYGPLAIAAVRGGVA